MGTFFNRNKITSKTLGLLLMFMLSIVVARAQNLDDFRSATSGNWSTVATWQRWDGTSWVAATATPTTNSPTTIISILNSHSVTISLSINSLSRVVVETGGTLVIGTDKTIRFGPAVPDTKLTVKGTLINNGIIVFSGSSSIAAGGILNNQGTLTFSGSTLQLDVFGTVRNSSDNVYSSTAVLLRFNNGSVYDHNFTTTPGVIPNATWSTGSLCLISGYTSFLGAPLNSTQSFYNFNWNTPALLASATATIPLASLNGNLNIINTGAGVLYIQTLSSIKQNFTTNAAARVQLGFLDNVQVEGDITLASGSIISVNKFSLTLTNPTLPQTLDGQGLTLNDLTIDKPGLGVTLASALKLKGSLSILSTSSVFNSGGFLTLLSTNDEGSGNASVATLPAGSSVAGAVVVEHYMSNEGNIYRYLSSPVANFTVSNFQNDVPVTGNFAGASGCTGCASHNASMYYYATAITSYNAFPNTPQTNVTSTFEVGRGYAAFINQNVLPGPVTIHWSGLINQGTVNLPVVFNGNPNTSWNLVGNPYPATVDWNKGQVDGLGWTFTNIAKTIAVKDNPTGSFQYYPDEAGESFNVGLIAKGQSFWVRATAANAALQIREDAKTPEIGTFYRKATAIEPTDRIVVSLSNGSRSDRAYFKIIDGATKLLDDYDAPKMANDGKGVLNISSIAPKATLPMAINAVDNIACADTIKLRVNGQGGQPLVAGNYSLSFLSSGVMNNFTWQVRDVYMGTTVILSDVSPYTFTVTNVSASKSASRFQLIALEKPADSRVKITGESQLCSGADSQLILLKPEARVKYTVLVNGKPVLETKADNAAELVLAVAGNNFLVGNNVVKILAGTSCTQKYLADSLVIMKSAYYEPATHVSPVCQHASVALEATDIPAGCSVRWYASSTSTGILSTQRIFTTPVLEKSETYFVTGLNPSGCESNRAAVVAKVIVYDEVLVNQFDGVLKSTYTSGNQWYFNNQVIDGATQQVLELKDKGLYSVKVTHENCQTVAHYDYAKGNAIADDFNVLVYPNPVNHAPVHIVVPESTHNVRLLNSMGSVVVESIIFSTIENGIKKADVDLSKYATGIYFFAIERGGKVITLKVFNK